MNDFFCSIVLLFVIQRTRKPLKKIKQNLNRPIWMIIVQNDWWSSNMDGNHRQIQLDDFLWKIHSPQMIIYSSRSDMSSIRPNIILNGCLSSNDILPSWMNIVLLGRKLTAVDENRSRQMNIICSSWISSVVDEYHPTYVFPHFSLSFQLN
jgi:hypothetical protein